MKRLWITAAAMLLLFGVLTAQAAPYTEEELEGYMQAIYIEQPWSQEYSEFSVQFIDVDFDGRKELLSMEAGQGDTPKNAHAYAFMDAELSHRGFLTVGKLDVCRDPETDESFTVNFTEQDGEQIARRLVYDPEDMVIIEQPLSKAQVARLESYGYTPAVITKAEWQTIKDYEDCLALCLPAYQQGMYKNGTPPLSETPDGEDAPSFPMEFVWIVSAAVLVAVAATVTAVVIKARR